MIPQYQIIHRWKDAFFFSRALRFGCEFMLVGWYTEDNINNLLPAVIYQ